MRRFFLGACLFFLVSPPPLSAEASGHVPAGRGRASWYGVTSTGKQTASGEMYNLSALTAAHKELPFGTVLRVHHLKNGKQVLVRVNDRGPFVGGRIVDLSIRAAEGLRMTSSGVAPVALEIVGNSKGEPLNRDNRFYVHIASAPSALKLWRIAGTLGKKIRKPMRALASYQGDDPVLALCLGPYKNFSQAQKDFLTLEEKKIRAQGIVEAPAQGGNIPRHEPPAQHSPSPGRKAGKDRNLFLPSALNAISLVRDCPASSLNIVRNIPLFGLMRNVVSLLTCDESESCRPAPENPNSPRAGAV